MKLTLKNKICLYCGKRLKDNFEFVRNVVTGDLERVCLKCAKTLPKLQHYAVEELDNA